jgi:hypothetical protein
MAAIYSNGGNRWNILAFNFTKRDALSSVYKISMITLHYNRYSREMIAKSISHIIYLCNPRPKGINQRVTHFKSMKHGFT